MWWRRREKAGRLAQDWLLWQLVPAELFCARNASRRPWSDSRPSAVAAGKQFDIGHFLITEFLFFPILYSLCIQLSGCTHWNHGTT